MCNLCKNIYMPTEAHRWKKNWWNWEENQPYTIIVKYDDCFELWHMVNDNYYTGRVMEIRYCPTCGEELQYSNER